VEVRRIVIAIENGDRDAEKARNDWHFIVYAMLVAV
jgi:hypothetical protein